MKAMTCTTCHKVVYVNNTGICLGCQMRSSELMGDEWKPEQPANKVMSQEEILTERVKELENAIQESDQESEAKSVDVCEQTSDGQGVAKRNSKRKKASPKDKEEKVKLPENWGKVDAQVF